MNTLKSQSNVPLYSNTVNGTLAVDGWVDGWMDGWMDVTFGAARSGLSGLQPLPVLSSLYQM